MPDPYYVGHGFIVSETFIRYVSVYIYYKRTISSSSGLKKYHEVYISAVCFASFLFWENLHDVVASDWTSIAPGFICKIMFGFRTQYRFSCIKCRPELSIMISTHILSE